MGTDKKCKYSSGRARQETARERDIVRESERERDRENKRTVLDQQA